ncbi:assimilatory sulfite reductase (NADPH) flavoprotein subunit [Colwellia sp. 1_MG-2023]|jgi:sulfite reductase (NADPH) flavoprotein alpha-component|uniref:assimilatory sulfite reductase (NADPH) flavoprotein subunit n=1 Tax=unclassified Colwellia TaxID=196834 RepID=UPI001C08E758|nr:MULTISPECIES: assimilatory sulfite reductase (NADPH) flavoprotein subunit [unclassified Colwellia]MBU2924057.1 assimilatory sulfite reductase (NADPH) flavoprotein subunit [Colwellia sp. C2M11]MDO6651947.1 assimilatory sulfite reductase (NADPH) flavoprotein subunit [Colwellia sp. 3_MG-2023]MDO6664723.1 assimilatory sulfite reductase (NADPH) flavoprotein subunit [Colwellia sp. 2_MG-2023]MDO6689235.1 assimilatory sulfite reductase (NADPH) flavoprotein subunit [Colwellia sp. 1_MG-2023]
MPQEQQNSNTVSSSLDANQLVLLQQATSGYSSLQLAWASGYLAAKSEQGANAQISPVAPLAAVAAKTLTILYASQTGNAKGVASKLAASAKAAGISVVLKNTADYKAKSSLKNETHLLIVASTNGEGEAPDDAIEFHEFLLGKKAPKLPNLSYSVLALGDSSYEFFCQTGKDFDERLQALGAKQLAPRVDCDVDYDSDCEAWTSSIIESLKDELTQPATTTTASLGGFDNLPTAGAASQYSKQNPLAAEFSLSQKITGRDSAKDVRHIEIDLGESGLTYQVGDALGVWFENDEALVDNLLSELSFSGDEKVSLKVSGEVQEFTLKNALISQLEITQTAPAFIEFWALQSKDAKLTEVASDKNSAREFAGEHQIIDVVKIAKADVDAQTFVDALRQITPRLYSIASAQAEVEAEVHLTVGVVNFDANGESRTGGASGFLANRLEEGQKVRVFVEHNDNFRLPESDDTPVIMIGPGTGVAPFRAFMQAREARDATGDNWMFFGDQTFTQDFLYQVEWQNYLKSGLLTRMDVAFSRDQAEKIYVQDRLKEQASDVFAWLERGAHLYICGDANRMAKDVHQTLIEIIAEHGKLSTEQAEDYLKSLRSNKRYQKDVY